MDGRGYLSIPYDACGKSSCGPNANFPAVAVVEEEVAAAGAAAAVAAVAAAAAVAAVDPTSQATTTPGSAVGSTFQEQTVAREIHEEQGLKDNPPGEDATRVLDSQLTNAQATIASSEACSVKSVQALLYEAALGVENASVQPKRHGSIEGVAVSMQHCSTGGCSGTERASSSVVDREVASGESCKQVTPSWLPPERAQAELAMVEDGMVGSWYPVTLLQVNAEDQVAHVEVAALQQGRGADAPLCEWQPLTQLRPPPPRTPDDFWNLLKPDSIAEVWYQGGWWQVMIKRAVRERSVNACQSSASDPGYAVSQPCDAASVDASEVGAQHWVVESVQYATTHCVLSSSLRPAWQWNRVDELGWTVQQQICIAPSKRARKRKHGEVHSSAKDVSPAESRVAREPPKASREPPRAPREARESVLQYSVGQLLEVQGTEDGFIGSWYTARVLEPRGARSSSRLRVCFVAFQEDDGSMYEDTVDVQHVRPLPPAHEPSFLDSCKNGSPLEVLLEDGWWEVSLHGMDGPKYVVGAERYRVRVCLHFRRTSLCT